MSRFALTKRRRILLATVVICASLITGLTVLWQTRPVAQAAILTPHPGLVGWWRFDEGSGSVATDSSGNGNKGTINGASWATGKYGDALSFDGASNYVSMSHNSVLSFGTGNFSAGAWIKTTDTTAGEHVV
jgi:hypothetical protein